MRTDPERLVEPLVESCGDCHRAESDVWQRTAHATSFDDLHRKQRAIEIAEALDTPLVKRNSVCLRCHYTAVAVEANGVLELRAGAGVSCQSCHGAARDWINVHNDYGIAESDARGARTLETPEHRATRITRSKAQGMLRPSELYAVAATCYECHIVSIEALVNRTSHRSGSSEFELVNWSQGAMRHNFLESYLTGDGTENAQRSTQWRRMMYVLGRALEVEFSIRALAVATQNGRYFRALKTRIDGAVRSLELIYASEQIPEVYEILDTVSGLELDLGNTGPLLRAADRVSATARRFTMTHDGAGFVGLDTMIRDNAESVPLFSR